MNCILVGRREKVTYLVSKEDLIENISSVTHEQKEFVKNVLEALNNTVREYLSGVNAKEEVSIKVLDGITIDGYYQEGKEKRSNITKEKITVSPKIKIKANISKYFKNKINAESR